MLPTIEHLEITSQGLLNAYNIELTQLRHITLNFHFHKINGAIVVNLTSRLLRCEYLESVAIRSLREVTDSSLKELGKLPLVEFDLAHQYTLSFSGGGLHHVTKPSLRHLALRGVDCVSEDEAKKLFANLNCLKSLVLKFCCEELDDNLHCLPSLATLTELTLNPISARTIALFPRMTNLRKLQFSLSYYADVDAVFLDMTKSLPLLNTLIIQEPYLDKLTAASLPHSTSLTYQHCSS